MKKWTMALVLLMGLPGVSMATTDFPGIYAKFRDAMENGIRQASSLDLHVTTPQGQELPLTACEKGYPIRSFSGSDDLDLSGFCDKNTVQLWINRVPGTTGNGVPYDAEVYVVTHFIYNYNYPVDQHTFWYRIQYQGQKVVEYGDNTNKKCDGVRVGARLPNGELIEKEKTCVWGDPLFMTWHGADRKGLVAEHQTRNGKEWTETVIPISNISEIHFRQRIKDGKEDCFAAGLFTQYAYREFYPDAKAFDKCDDLTPKKRTPTGN